MIKMPSLPSVRSSLLTLSVLLFLLGTAEGIAGKNTLTLEKAEVLSYIDDSSENPLLNFAPAAAAAAQQPQQQQTTQRRYLRKGKSLYYEFLDGDGQSSTTTSLLDVWLCLAVALGWSVLLVSTQQPQQEIFFGDQDYSKVMGHVLQVSLGEDALGTGIPVYYALIDFVVEGETDEEHTQVRKVFASKKILEEGFANVEILYLRDDPTTAILMDDLIDQRKEQKSQQSSSSTAYNFAIYFVSMVLIGFSVYGGFRLASRLKHPLYGWISLGVGLLLLYPAAKLLYRLVTHLYSLAGPMTERPGVIVHGKRLYWAKRCHGTLNPMEILGGDDYNYKREDNSDRSIELSHLQLPRIEDNDDSGGANSLNHDATKSAKPKRFPNAGCGFGNFNVHLPVGRSRAASNVSSMSASGSQNSETGGSSSDKKSLRNDISILEKYEQHVSSWAAEELKVNKFCLS